VGPWKICVSVVETTHDKAARAIQEATGLQTRRASTDYLKNPKLEKLPIDEKDGLIITRRKAEGGRYIGNEKIGLGILKEAWIWYWICGCGTGK
jgi:hypothetical protein